MTISSHWTGRACVHLALWGHLACPGQSEETRGSCLASVSSFCPVLAQGSLWAAITWRVKTPALSKGGDVSRGKSLACAPARLCGCGCPAEPPLPTGSSPMPVQRASINRGRGWDRGLLPRPWGKGRSPCFPESSAMSWVGGRHLCDQATWREGASPGSTSAWARGAGAGRRLWVVRVFNALWLAARGAGQAVCWAPSPGWEESRELNSKEKDGSGSSRWELGQRSAWEVGAVGSWPQWGWWLGGGVGVCCSSAGGGLVRALKMNGDLIWKEPWVCAIQTVMLMRAAYIWGKVCRFYLSSFPPPPVLFSLSGLAGLALSWYHQFNLQYFVCSFKHLSSWLWCWRGHKTIPGCVQMLLRLCLSIPLTRHLLNKLICKHQYVG